MRYYPRGERYFPAATAGVTIVFLTNTYISLFLYAQLENTRAKEMDRREYTHGFFILEKEQKET